MMTILSCSKKQIIRTEIQKVEVIKFKPLDGELTKDCSKITIADKQHNVTDLMTYILDLIKFNQNCTDRMNKIKVLTASENN
jgi:hypothetical protein